MAHRSVSSRWRALTLILIGLVAGTLLLGTASAHIGTPSHLWKKHIKPKVKQLTYTKAQANARFDAKGDTITGEYALRGWTDEDGAISHISYGITLPSDPVAHFITGGPTADCPGTASNPQAASGHLCVYENSQINIGTRCIVSTLDFACPPDKATKFGALIFINSAAAGVYQSRGTWAVNPGPAGGAAPQRAPGSSGDTHVNPTD